MSYNGRVAQNQSKMASFRGPNVRRRDIKERTMNRLVAIDGDIASVSLLFPLNRIFNGCLAI
jgi:hypothetical protein